MHTDGTVFIWYLDVLTATFLSEKNTHLIDGYYLQIQFEKLVASMKIF